MRKHATRALPILALVALLTGCGATPAAVEGATFSTASDLRQAFIDANGDCSEAAPLSTYALTAQALQCGDDVELLTFATENDRDRLVGTFKNASMVFLVGSNWIIVSDNADKLVDKMGGILVAPVKPVTKPSPSSTK